MTVLYRSEGFTQTGYFNPVRYGLGVWPGGKIVGASSPSSASVGFTGVLSLPGPPTLLPNGLGAQAFQARGPNGLEVHRFQSFSISRFTGHTRMLGPSVFPDSKFIFSQNLIKSTLFPKMGMSKKSRHVNFWKKNRRRPSGRDSQELFRRDPV